MTEFYNSNQRDYNDMMDNAGREYRDMMDKISFRNRMKEKEKLVQEEVEAQEKVYRAIEKQNILKAYELKLISREEALRSLESLETPQKNNKKR